MPALDVNPGTDFIGKPVGWGLQKFDEYTEKDYHKVSDEVKPDWNLSGQVEDLQLLFDIGVRVANGAKYPEWNAGNEFKAKRDSTLKAK